MTTITLSEKEEKQRVQFYFESEALEALDKMQEMTGLSSRAEVVRYGLRFFQWLLEETQERSEILVRKPNGELQGVILPFPKKVARAAATV